MTSGPLNGWAGGLSELLLPRYFITASLLEPTTAPSKLFPGVSSQLSVTLSLDRHAQSSQEFCTLILHLVFLQLKK